MRMLTCSSAFPRLIGCLLACYAASPAAAPVVLLEKARLVAADGAPEGGFGRAIAIDGDVAVVTANPQQATLAVGPDMPSAAYVFERQSSGAWTQTAKLSSGVEGDLYGIDVAVDGNVIVIGAIFGGVAYVYERVGGTWQQTAVLGTLANGGNGYSVAIQNNLIAIGEGYASHGLVLYRRQGSGWARIANYDNGLGLGDDEYYSPRVDISQNFAIHGSWGFDSEPPAPSTAYIYAPGAGGNWSQPTVTALTQPGTTNRVSGWSRNVAISASTALIDGDVFRYANGQWNHELRLAGATALDDDDATITAHSGPFRLVKLHRRTSAGSWPVRAELAVSDASSISSVSTDAGRVLLGSRPSAAAFIYEAPGNLDRPALAQDDFQDGDAIGWSTTPGSLFAVASSGTFRFYRQTATAGNAAALWQATAGSDQAIQADITPRAFNGADRWFGLVTRYTDGNNYYYVTARSGGGIQLKRMLGGTFVTLGSAALPVAIGTTHRIRLESVENHIRVLVDNRPVITVRDGALSGGRPGLMTYRARADFDNIVVNANPAVTAFATDFQQPNSSWQTAAGAWARVQTGAAWVLRQSDLSGGGARTFLAGGMRGDQIVEADLRPTQFSGADRWFGLMTRYRDDSNYHYVTLRSSNTLEIKKLVNGAIHVLASVPFAVQTNVSYRVRLETIGARVRIYVNGTLRAEATDASAAPAASGVGIAAYKTAMDADNFVVTQP